VNMTNEEYGKYIKSKAPRSKLFKNMLFAFLIGGAICCVGQGFYAFYEHLGLSKDDGAMAASISMVFLGALLTGVGVYDDIARLAGAGTLVPITGFANAVVSPALEFKSEGFITGSAAKVFTIAGPVILFGISASVVYGFILLIFQLV